MTEKFGLGAYLREIRERQGLTLEEIAEETKINCRFLRAIEEEAWEDLPGEVYVRGYLRAYAEAVGLDPGEVLARYSEIRREETKQEDDGSEECPLPWKGRRCWIILALIVLFLVALVVFFLTRS